MDGVVTTPCERCKATNLECVIGSSNRGGRRVRKRTLDQAGLGDEDTPSSARTTLSQPSAIPAREGNQNPSLNQYRSEATPSHSAWATDDYSSIQHGRGRTSPTPGIMLDPALQAADTNARDMLDRTSSGSDNIAFNDLQNPSDALGILAQIASNGESKCRVPTPQRNLLMIVDAPHYSNPSYGSSSNYGKSQLDYALVREGRLSFSKILLLLQRYKHYYHPYFPLVPAATLDAVNLSKTAVEEPHLLTAILVIASRDLNDEPHVFIACSEHMRALVSALAAGGPGNVEAVEVCESLQLPPPRRTDLSTGAVDSCGVDPLHFSI